MVCKLRFFDDMVFCGNSVLHPGQFIKQFVLFAWWKTRTIYLRYIDSEDRKTRNVSHYIRNGYNLFYLPFGRDRKTD